MILFALLLKLSGIILKIAVALNKNANRQMKTAPPILSIILPTYNESQTILKVLNSVEENLSSGIASEIIVVDDNSPDNTGFLVEEYANQKVRMHPIHVIHRQNKAGLSSAILQGILSSQGEIIVVMDSDFSHPPQAIRRMIQELNDPGCDIVIASRYVKGGSIVGWPFKRRIISKGATKIAQRGLGIKEIADPMSGFFAFKRQAINGIVFDAIGYKLLLEILVKRKDLNIKEIPYIFTNRKSGTSKLDTRVIFDYIRAVWKLYRYGKTAREKEKRTSVHFLSKAARFYTVGASGLLLNYVISVLFGSIVFHLAYLPATAIGITFSIASNFVLNKIWTFEDREFPFRKTIKQFTFYLGFSALGALVQLGMLYLLMELSHINYSEALILAVAVAATGNFLLNKKWTFNQRLWS